MRNLPPVLCLILLASCGNEIEAMPYLTDVQRACLAQVKTAVNLQPGETASLFVSKAGDFTGAVTKGGFTRYALPPKPYDDCIAEAAESQVVADLSEIAPGIVLNSEDKALWDTLTAAQRERALTFLANGGTIQSSLAEN